MTWVPTATVWVKSRGGPLTCCFCLRCGIESRTKKATLQEHGLFRSVAWSTSTNLTESRWCFHRRVRRPWGDLDERPRLTRCTRARRRSLDRPNRPLRECVCEVCSQIPPSRFTDPSELLRFDPGHRIVPVLRRGSGSPWSSMLTAHGLGEADRESMTPLRKRGHSRARLGHGSSLRRHLQRPSGPFGPRALAGTPSSDSWSARPSPCFRCQVLEPPETNRLLERPKGRTRLTTQFRLDQPAHRREDVHELSLASTFTTGHGDQDPPECSRLPSGAVSDGLEHGLRVGQRVQRRLAPPGWCGMRLFTPSVVVRRVSHPWFSKSVWISRGRPGNRATGIKPRPNATARGLGKTGQTVDKKGEMWPRRPSSKPSACEWSVTL